jgi:hypothetical protein
LNNADVERVLWLSHYFSTVVNHQSFGSVTAEFLSLGFFEGHVQKQSALIKRTEKHTKLCGAENVHWIASGMRNRVDAFIPEPLENSST